MPAMLPACDALPALVTALPCCCCSACPQHQRPSAQHSALGAAAAVARHRPGKRGTLPPGPETGTGRDVTPPPYAYMPGPDTTSKNLSISLLFSAGFRLEITPLPFFPKKIFKPKIRQGSGRRLTGAVAASGLGLADP